MRTSSFIPISIPIVAGMVLCPPTQAFTIFWQIMNQSYMAGLNIGNANEASGSQGNGQLMKAYCMATGTAISVACSLRLMTPYLLKGRTGGIAAFMNYFIGYSAVASSSAINVYAMRKNEIETGVSVKDEATGEDLGLSSEAAKQGIDKTIIARVIHNIPAFLVPAIWNLFLQRNGLMPKRMGPTRLTLELMGMAMGLYIAMPLNCALYP